MLVLGQQTLEHYWIFSAINLMIIGFTRMNTNGSNWSGFWEASDNIYLILRDDLGNTDVYLRPNGNSYFNGGNIGIGTTTPSEKTSNRKWCC